MVVINAKSVKTFLDNISPIHSRLSEHHGAEYVFRGQGNSKWSLFPAAFRPDTKTPHDDEMVVGFKRTYREQRDLEWSVLRNFVLEMNRHGHRIPDEELFYKLRDKNESLEEQTVEFHPNLPRVKFG